MKKAVLEDLFTRNPKYQKTPLHPSDIIEPIGYDTIQSFRRQTTPRTNRNIPIKQQIFKLNEEGFQTIIFNRKGFEAEDMLEVEDNPGKKTYAGGDNVSYFYRHRSLFKEQKQRLSWFPVDEKYGNTKILKLIELLSCGDSIFQIRDYSLSYYCYYLECSNQTYRTYIFDTLNEEFINYRLSEAFAKHPKIAVQQKREESLELPMIDVEELSEVQARIALIHKQNQQKDLLYNGLHLYIAIAKPIKQNSEVDCESNYLKYLQYHLLMISGTLADGQTAILKIYSNLKHKTNDYLFLLKSIFYKTTIVKPHLSSLFSDEKFLICEGFKKNLGNAVHKHLVANYHLLKQHGEQKSLVKSKVIFRSDFVKNVEYFNDRLINKCYKVLCDQIKRNPSTVYIPNIETLTKKAESFRPVLPFKQIVTSVFSKAPSQYIKSVQSRQAKS